MSIDRRKTNDTTPTRLETFVNIYAEMVLRGKPNATQAAIKAGYSARSAGQTAHSMLQRPEVKEYLARITFARAKELEIEGKRVLSEIAGIAFSPIQPGYIGANDKRQALHDLGEYLKLWEGSRGDKVLVFNILPQDERLL